jgi:hypothetical protein
MINGVEYLKIDDAGLHVRVNGEPRLFEVDTVIVCAGQLPLRALHDELQAAGMKSSLVGGAFEAGRARCQAGDRSGKPHGGDRLTLARARAEWGAGPKGPGPQPRRAQVTTEARHRDRDRSLQPEEHV